MAMWRELDQQRCTVGITQLCKKSKATPSNQTDSHCEVGVRLIRELRHVQNIGVLLIFFIDQDRTTRKLQFTPIPRFLSITFHFCGTQLRDQSAELYNMSTLSNLVNFFDPDGAGVRKADLRDFIYYVEPERVVPKNALLAELREVAWEVKRKQLGQLEKTKRSSRRLSRQVSFCHEDTAITPPIAHRLRSQTREYPNPHVTVQRSESIRPSNARQYSQSHKPRPTSTPQGSRNHSPYPTVPSPTDIEQLISRSKKPRGRSASMSRKSNILPATSRAYPAGRSRQENQHDATEQYNMKTPSPDESNESEKNDTECTTDCNSYSLHESPDDQPRRVHDGKRSTTTWEKQRCPEPSDESSNQFSTNSEVLNPHNYQNQLDKSTHRLWLDYSEQTRPREPRRQSTKTRRRSLSPAKSTGKIETKTQPARLKSAMRKKKGTIPSGFSPPLPETFQPRHNLRQMSEHHNHRKLDQKIRTKKPHRPRTSRKCPDSPQLHGQTQTQDCTTSGKRQFLSTRNHLDTTTTSEASYNDSEDSPPIIKKIKHSLKAPKSTKYVKSRDASAKPSPNPQCECRHHHCSAGGNQSDGAHHSTRGNHTLSLQPNDTDLSPKITDTGKPKESLDYTQIDPHLRSVPQIQDIAPPTPSSTKPIETVPQIPDAAPPVPTQTKPVNCVPQLKDVAPPIPTQTKPSSSKSCITHQLVANPVPHSKQQQIWGSNPMPTIDPQLVHSGQITTGSQPAKEKSSQILAEPTLNTVPNVSNLLAAQSPYSQAQQPTVHNTLPESKTNSLFNHRVTDSNEREETINANKRPHDFENPLDMRLRNFSTNLQENVETSQNKFPGSLTAFPNQAIPMSSSKPSNYTPLSSNSYQMFSFGTINQRAFGTNTGTNSKQENDNTLGTSLAPVGNFSNTSSTSSTMMQFNFASKLTPVSETDQTSRHAPSEQAVRPLKHIPNSRTTIIKLPNVPQLAPPEPPKLSIVSPQSHSATAQPIVSCGSQIDPTRNPPSQLNGSAPSLQASDTHITISLAQLQQLLSGLGANGVLPIAQLSNNESTSQDTKQVPSCSQVSSDQFAANVTNPGITSDSPSHVSSVQEIRTPREPISTVTKSDPSSQMSSHVSADTTHVQSPDNVNPSSQPNPPIHDGGKSSAIKCPNVSPKDRTTEKSPSNPANNVTDESGITSNTELKHVQLLRPPLSSTQDHNFSATEQSDFPVHNQTPAPKPHPIASSNSSALSKIESLNPPVSISTIESLNPPVSNETYVPNTNPTKLSQRPFPSITEQSDTLAPSGTPTSNPNVIELPQSSQPPASTARLYPSVPNETPTPNPNVTKPPQSTLPSLTAQLDPPVPNETPTLNPPVTNPPQSTLPSLTAQLDPPVPNETPTLNPKVTKPPQSTLPSFNARLDPPPNETPMPNPSAIKPAKSSLPSSTAQLDPLVPKETPTPNPNLLVPPQISLPSSTPPFEPPIRNETLKPNPNPIKPPQSSLPVANDRLKPPARTPNETPTPKNEINPKSSSLASEHPVSRVWSTANQSASNPTPKFSSSMAHKAAYIESRKKSGEFDRRETAPTLSTHKPEERSTCSSDPTSKSPEPTTKQLTGPPAPATSSIVSEAPRLTLARRQFDP